MESNTFSIETLSELYQALDKTNHSVGSQVTAFKLILKKSNNILLKLDDMYKMQQEQQEEQPKLKIYKFSNDFIRTMIAILEKYEKLIELKKNIKSNSQSVKEQKAGIASSSKLFQTDEATREEKFDNYKKLTIQNLDKLSNIHRRLLALHERLHNMKQKWSSIYDESSSSDSDFALGSSSLSQNE